MKEDPWLRAEASESQSLASAHTSVICRLFPNSYDRQYFPKESEYRPIGIFPPSIPIPPRSDALK